MCSSRLPVAVTASRIARLTAGSRVRSAGSSKFSDLRTYATTRWSGRPGLASCGEDCCVSVAGAAHTRLSARLTASLSNVKSIESMLLKRWLGSCARRCVSRLPRKALLDRLAFWTYKKVSIRPVATSIARAPHALPCRALAPSPRGGSAGARVAMLALVIPRVLGMMRPVRVARTSDTFRGFRVRFAASSSSDATSVPPGRPNTDTDTIDTPTPVSTVNNASAHKGPTVKRTAGKVAPRRTAESRRTDWNGVPDDESGPSTPRGNGLDRKSYVGSDAGPEHIEVHRKQRVKRFVKRAPHSQTSKGSVFPYTHDDFDFDGVHATAADIEKAFAPLVSAERQVRVGFFPNPK